MSPPLDDVRILAIEQYGAGPWGTLQLAGLGADVIKIEDPSPGRRRRALRAALPGGRGLALLRDVLPEQALRLARPPASRARRSSRTWCERPTPSTRTCAATARAKLRITYDDLKHLKPDIVCCSLSGFGMTGPRAAEGGYDYVMQGIAGWMSLTGDPDGPPMKSGLSLVDLSTGYAAALGLMGGLWRARREGTGCDGDVSLFETALHELMYVGTWVVPAATSRSGSRSPRTPRWCRFRTSRPPTAGSWSHARSRSSWSRLRGARAADLASDPRFADFAGRHENRGGACPGASPFLPVATTDEWLAVLGAAGVPNARVNDVAEALAERQVAARGGFIERSTPGSARSASSPRRCASARTRSRPAARLSAASTRSRFSSICAAIRPSGCIARRGRCARRPNLRSRSSSSRCRRRPRSRARIRAGRSPVLERDAGRVEDRDLLVGLAALLLAGDHLADLAGDVVLGDEAFP